VPDPEHGPATTRRLAAAHLGAVALDFARGVIVTLAGVLATRPLVDALGASWPISRDATVGLLLVGGSVSVGILLRDLGGFRRHAAAFVAGLALTVLGARLL
jgi:hypothetical protein